MRGPWPKRLAALRRRLGRCAEPSGKEARTAEVMATFRAGSDVVLEGLLREADGFATRLAAAHDLGCVLDRHEPFPSTVSDPSLTARLLDFLRRTGRPHRVREAPFPWSEDFGRYASLAPLLFFGLGAGMDTPALHHPGYVFPDALTLEASEMMHDFLMNISAWEDAPA